MSEHELLTAEDLLEMGYDDDPFLLEDPSLCALCSHTISDPE